MIIENNCPKCNRLIRVELLMKIHAFNGTFKPQIILGEMKCKCGYIGKWKIEGKVEEEILIEKDYT